MLHYATDGRTKFSLSGSPYFYQNASHGWDKKIEPGQKRDKYRYRDSMGRVKHMQEDDFCVDPANSKLVPLVVQAVDDVYQSEKSQNTWSRTYVGSVVPLRLQVAFWTSTYSDQGKKLTLWDWPILFLKYLFSCFLLIPVVSASQVTTFHRCIYPVGTSY